MKKVSILMLAVLSLTLFSFIAGPGDGISKTAEHIYTVSPIAKSKVNQADQSALVNLIKKEYNLTDADMKKGVVLNSLERKGFWVVDTHIGPNWIDKRVVYDALRSNGGQVKEMEAILAKYVAR